MSSAVGDEIQFKSAKSAAFHHAALCRKIQ